MWLHLPTLICSQASLCLGKASKPAADTLALKLAASVMSRGKYMPQEFWRRVCKKGALPKHLCIPTCAPSAAESSAVKWMRSLADSLARTSALQGSGPESKERSLDSGLSSSASFATYDPKSSSWKTSQASLITQLWDEYSETWPRQGSMRSGVVFRRRKLGRPISGNGGSVWPTAMAEDSESCGNHPGAQDSLTGMVAMWPTASTGDGKRGDRTQHCENYPQAGMDLKTAANIWQTPATDSFRSRGGDRVDEQGLDQQARLWATPKAISGGANSQRDSRPETGGPDLQEQVQTWHTTPKNGDESIIEGSHAHAGTPTPTTWQTPQSRDFRGGLIEPETAAKHLGALPLNEQVMGTWSTPHLPTVHSSDNSATTYLDRQVSSLQVQATAQPGSECPPTLRPRLNPAFVCTLMGMPWYWTHPEPINSGAEETELWRLRLDSHLSRLLEGLE